jgi:hypothetical protein
MSGWRSSSTSTTPANTLQRNGLQIDLVSLRNYLAEGRHLDRILRLHRHAPAPDQQQVDQEAQLRLRQHGFLIQTKPGRLLPNGRLKCDFDWRWRWMCRNSWAARRPTSSSSSLARRLHPTGRAVALPRHSRRGGFRACSIARSLRSLANGFVDLTQISEPVQNLQLPRPEPELVKPEPQFAALEEALLPA